VTRRRAALSAACALAGLAAVRASNTHDSLAAVVVGFVLLGAAVALL